VRFHERFSSILRRSSGSHEPDSPRDARGAGEAIRRFPLVSSFERRRDDAWAGLARDSLAPAARDDAADGSDASARVEETTRIARVPMMRSWE
jgi:hypothetical protein